MSVPAVSVDRLSKRYRLGRTPGAASGLYARLTGLMRGDRPQRGQEGPDHDQTLWALKDVSFEVAPGEVIGLVGHNGAGKSTLLKILSRITEPTSGRARIRGRVGSLLEVGTGFHPELTGRENIFLSGAVLGMRRIEIARKFDEIVAFADVAKFLDTPVKRYSSGMYVRLAFAVAAQLEPEVLLVDEVLAVGDAAFQKKCLGKMGDVAEQGRTVLFVSHNMVAVQNLCQRAVWLEHGRIEADGPAKDIVKAYLSASTSSETERSWPELASAPGNEKVRLRSLSVRPADGGVTDAITMSTPVKLEVEYWNLLPDQSTYVSLQFLTEQQVVAFATISRQSDGTGESAPSRAGLVRSTCRIPADLLNSGTYAVRLLIHSNGARIAFRLDNALSFEVLDLEQRNAGWYGREPGVLHPILPWKTEYLADVPRTFTPVAVRT